GRPSPAPPRPRRGPAWLTRSRLGRGDWTPPGRGTCRRIRDPLVRGRPARHRRHGGAWDRPARGGSPCRAYQFAVDGRAGGDGAGDELLHLRAELRPVGVLVVARGVGFVAGLPRDAP